MQNKYAGDVGDFGKIGLLRQIASSGLRIGLNWYLAPDNNNGDGNIIGYLVDPRYIGCDDVLRESLNYIVNKERSVSALETRNLITNCIYYSNLLLPPKELSRQKWHDGALEALKPCDIVFLDPDNGLLVKSVSVNSSKSNKYVLTGEIEDYFAAGKSVIFYNHRCRQKVSVYLRRFDWISISPIFKPAYRCGLTFNRGTVRDYIFILQPNHKTMIVKCIDNMLQSPWGEHFKKLNFQ